MCVNLCQKHEWAQEKRKKNVEKKMEKNEKEFKISEKELTSVGCCKKGSKKLN